MLESERQQLRATTFPYLQAIAADCGGSPVISILVWAQIAQFQHADMTDNCAIGGATSPDEGAARHRSDCGESERMACYRRYKTQPCSPQDQAGSALLIAVVTQRRIRHQQDDMC